MKRNPIKITPDTKYPTMFRLEWEDGTLSADFYNLSRAHDILLHYTDYRSDMKKARPNIDFK